MRRVVPAVLAMALLAGLGFSVFAADTDKPKHTIKEVMKKAHGKSKLAQNVAKGKATDAQKKELVELYEAMAMNKQPKGEDASWKALNDELVAAAKDAQEGKEGAGARLSKAFACGTCHSKHKP